MTDDTCDQPGNRRFSSGILQRRFSDLSGARQAFVLACQSVVFGKITGLLVQDAEPAFTAKTKVFVDVKLDSKERPRLEESLADYELSAELVRLFSKLDDIRNGIIEQIEIRSGLPRRLVFKWSDVDGKVIRAARSNDEGCC